MINSEEIEILVIKIDCKFLFHRDIKSISQKTGQKLSALLRISPYLEYKKESYLRQWSNRDLITVR